MNDLELKRKRIELLVKAVVLVGICLVLGPFYAIIMHGLGALAAIVGTLLVGWVGVMFIPWFAAMIANARLKAIKFEAAKNPIETLQNEYKEKAQALADYRVHITEAHAGVENYHNQLETFKRQYPDEAEQLEAEYNKSKELLALKIRNYEASVQALKDFDRVIKKAQAKWEIGQAAAKMNKLVGADADAFFSKIMEETALDSVQKSLNTAFADLELSFVDEKSRAADRQPRQPAQLPDAHPVKALPPVRGRVTAAPPATLELEAVPVPGSNSESE